MDCLAVGDWLKTHEYIAVWAEGIALIAIFIWDRLDSAHERRISRNTERAWILTELDWPKHENLRVTLGTSSSPGKTNVETTDVNVMLKCRNDGRSPAWIDKVFGHVEIVDLPEELVPAAELESLASRMPRPFEQLGPVGPGVARAKAAHPCAAQFLISRFASYVEVRLSRFLLSPEKPATISS
jgi:hypothetical protein